MQNNISRYFGINLFDDAVMKERLSKQAYAAMQNTIHTGAELEPDTAKEVADAMKDWAVERGATHFTHWFQPLTGYTAEKHDSFMEPDGKGGVILRLSGKNLIKGEPDASSLPSGGLRATFEARGYTAWDCTSPAFLKEDAGGSITLCIPTAYCSYNGEALDQKTPLLRSMVALNRHALRILRLFGDYQTKRVVPNVGAEQEYFLIDKRFVDARMDLRLTGKTLTGLPPIKGQVASRHYYGAMTDRVAKFTSELDIELWKLGIHAKTKHNETAPCQHEMAPVYVTANIACDQNHLVMETMKKVADRQGLACLLTEKPFLSINGSGKHNNWSIATDRGHNLLEPGKTPYDNAQFLIFLSAVIRAVDRHAGLLRLSCASASNDRRLGGFEAPPAIISMFLGDELTALIEKVKTNVERRAREHTLHFGVPTLPEVYRDNTDRNRTSPFAFTGNKFEFRMPGASQSLSECNTVLNAIVAESLDHIATRLEGADNFAAEVREVFRDILFGHGRILFDGDGYAKEWEIEARKRGLPVICDTVEAIAVLKSPATQRLYQHYGVYTEPELDARHEVLLEQYASQVKVEAGVLLAMAQRQILPAAAKHLGESCAHLSGIALAEVPCQGLKRQIDRLGEATQLLTERVEALRERLAEPPTEDVQSEAIGMRDGVLPLVALLSEACNAVEGLLPADVWPLPTQDDILYHDIRV